MTKDEKNRRSKWLVIMLLSLAIVVVCVILLIPHFLPSAQDNSSYKNTTSATESSDKLVDNPIDFASLQAKNADVCAWINVPGTIIDYPILQSAANEEENFYLTHDLNKEAKFEGAVYIQKMNSMDFSDPNTVIYGHDLRTGKMFSSLRRFKKATFFNSNSTIKIYTPGHIKTYEIISAFVYDDRHILNSFNFYDPEQYQNFLDEVKNPASMVKNVRAGSSVTTSDRIITLSTCTDHAGERYLVVGVLKNDELTK